MTAPEVQFAALTDVGRVRDQNEDNFLVDKKLGLFIVCDGMGGHAAGEVASALAVRTMHDEIKKQADLIVDYAAQAVGAAKVTKKDILNMLEFAVNRASQRVHTEAVKDSKKRGMGTTLVCLLVIGTQAFIIYVGDSRIYMLRGGLLEQLTEDHTVYNELIRRKKMAREQVEQLAQKNAITRAVGVYEHVEPDTLVLDLTAGDRFLLCSDGLCGYFEEDLGGLGVRLGNPDADAACKSLIDAANERGGKDNITSVIVTVGDVTSRDEMRAKRLQLKRDILARMPLFRPLNDREILRVLQVTDVCEYKNGELIISEGDKGEELFIVLSGQAKVMRNGAELATFNAGDHFGEMALVRSQPRSASVLSSGNSELMVIRRSEFFEILRKEQQLAVKLLWQFLGVLADRLADTSRELGAAKEELALEDISNEIFAEDEDDNRKTLLIPASPTIATRGLSVPSGQRLACLFLSLACVGACKKLDQSAKPSASASATPSASPAGSEPRAVPNALRAKAACRALEVTGSATVDGAPLATGALLDGAHWVELSAGASVALRHSATSREFKLIGAAHALPCRDGSEQILLADGRLSTSANLGVRPGAEVLIATPEGVVHYGDAALDLSFGARGLRVRVKAGEAWVEPEERGKPHFQNPVRSGAEARLPSTLPKRQSLVDACESAAVSAQESARRVLDVEAAGASGSLGDRAAAHMRERSKARTACAIAAAAVFSESDPAKRQSLSASVAHADELWQRVPRALR